MEKKKNKNIDTKKNNSISIWIVGNHKIYEALFIFVYVDSCFCLLSNRDMVPYIKI